MHCYFFSIILDNLILLCFLCYPVLYTIRFAGILCIVFVIHGLVSRKILTVVIIVLGLWSSSCKDKNNF